jgi:ribosome-associated toxin RatA of RatAB toxin-antitoxin module
MDLESARQGNWEFRVEHKNIRIYSSKMSNSSVLGFKGEIEFPVSVKKLISLFYDTNNYRRWVHQLAAMEVLERNEDLEYVIRQVINTPWPLPQREMIVKTGIQGAGDNSIAVTMKGLPDYLPVNPRYHRVRKTDGVWIFTPAEHGRVRITFVMHVNPGNDVPSPVSNTAMFEVPFYSLQNLRNLAQDPSYNPPYPGKIENHICIIEDMSDMP